MRPFGYHAPATLDEAAGLMSDGARPLAGGTDLLVQLKARRRSVDAVVSLRRIPGLRGVRREGDGLVVGALTTLTELAAEAPLLAPVVRRMASEQIRNLATVGGNLCNASPAADLAPPLLALDARVRTSARREIALRDFFVGPGRTVLGPREILTEIAIPRLRPIAFEKLERRGAMDIAVVSVAASRVNGAVRLALGAVAPTPILSDESLSGIAPIDDVRATAAYRRRVAGVLVRRVLEALR